MFWALLMATTIKHAISCHEARTPLPTIIPRRCNRAFFALFITVVGLRVPGFRLMDNRLN